jgi:AmmeMemoRadiSam system protein B
MISTRSSAVKGIFYPESCSKIKIYFQKFNNMIDEKMKKDSILDIKPKALIVPHAGYIYSGYTANIAYRTLTNSSVRRVIVIGPSHRYYFQEISGSYFEKYETPCGDIDIDTTYLMKIAKRFDIGFDPKAHQKEHSVEVQMPFIKYYLPKTGVIEIIYGNILPSKISPLITYLLQESDNLVIISSDLSHFHTQKRAKKLDKICLEAIINLDEKILDRGCEACGLIGIRAMIESANMLHLRSKLLDYRTSYDYSGDNSSVVGYGSSIFY